MTAGGRGWHKQKVPRGEEVLGDRTAGELEKRITL